MLKRHQFQIQSMCPVCSVNVVYKLCMFLSSDSDLQMQALFSCSALTFISVHLTGVQYLVRVLFCGENRTNFNCCWPDLGVVFQFDFCTHELGCFGCSVECRSDVMSHELGCFISSWMQCSAVLSAVVMWCRVACWMTTETSCSLMVTSCRRLTCLRLQLDQCKGLLLLIQSSFGFTEWLHTAT